MPKLLVIEPFQHQEVLFRWAELWRDSDWEVHFWVNPELLADCPAGLRNVASFHWTARPDGQDWHLFLQQQQQQLQAMDLVWWLTVGQRYELPLLVPSHIPLVTVVHNVGNLWQLGLGPDRSCKMMLRSVRMYLNGQHLHRKRFLSRPQTLVFPKEELRQAALPFLTSSQKAVVVPFGFQGPVYDPHTSKAVFQIAIPGAVRPDKKAYDMVFRTLAGLSPMGPKSIRLLLLGPYFTPEIGQWLQSWQRQLASQVQLVFFEHPLSDLEFQQQLRNSQLVILPLKRWVVYGSQWETIGQTKVSGGIQDAIYHRIPILLPDFYPLAGYPQQSIRFYENEEEFEQQLIQLWQEPKVPVEDWPSRSKERVRQQLLSVMDKAQKNRT